MLATKQATSAVARAAAPRAAPMLRTPRRSSTLCRAESERPESVQENSGFVAYDSAGQSNMYPVMTKAYAESGPAANATANAGFAIAAAVIAFGAIAVALVGLTTQSGPDASTEGLKALSEYAAKFAAEL